MSAEPLETGPNWAIYAGPTPNGGVKSLWMFSNDRGEPATMEQSTRVEILELDAEGNCIFRPYRYMNGASEPE